MVQKIKIQSYRSSECSRIKRHESKFMKDCKSKARRKNTNPCLDTSQTLNNHEKENVSIKEKKKADYFQRDTVYKLEGFSKAA